MGVPEQIKERVQVRLAEQRALVTSLLQLREQLQGSLFVRYGQCGKQGCACHDGPRHGPYYVLSQRSSGKGAFSYLEPERATEAKEHVSRYREFKKGMARLHKLNKELVELLRRYQRTQLQSTGRRLGLTAPR